MSIYFAQKDRQNYLLVKYLSVKRQKSFFYHHFKTFCRYPVINKILEKRILSQNFYLSSYP